MDEKALREFVSTALKKYNEALARHASEQETDFFIISVDEFIPDVLFTDLYFWGDRDRTDEEVVDKIVERARILSTDGPRGVLMRAIDQLRYAIDNQIEPACNYADGIIEGYAEKLTSA